MLEKRMTLQLLPQTFAIARLAPDAAIPSWALASAFFSVTKTSEELSIVCMDVPDDARIERGWRAIKVVGPLDFALTGILSQLANVLAEAKVSIFAISTFDTDYILVRDLDAAMTALTRDHEFVPFGD